MRIQHLVFALLVSATTAAAQPAGPTATAVKVAMDNAPAKTANGGTVGSPLQSAQQFMLSLRTLCQLVENEGKLFAACDNSTPLAKVHGNSYLPQTTPEWESLAKAAYGADRVVQGRGRPLVVLNGAKVMVEVSSGGVVTLK